MELPSLSERRRAAEQAEAERRCQIQSLLADWISARATAIAHTSGDIYGDSLALYQLATARAAFFGLDAPTREQCGLYYWDEDREGPEPATKP